MGAIGSHYAHQSTVPVSLLLNEAQTLSQVVLGIEAGFYAVMLDTSAWEWEAAVRTVAELAQIAHARDVTVEAELGRLPDATATGIDDSTAHLTDPDLAEQFVALTGTDCLAVSIGNVHLLTAHYAPIDPLHLEKIHAKVSVPLVIHGGTSFPPDAIPHAVAHGVAKFNVGTTLKKAYLEGVQNALESSKNLSVHDLLGSHKPADLCEAGKQAMKERVRSLIRLYGSAGKAS